MPHLLDKAGTYAFMGLDGVGEVQGFRSEKASRRKISVRGLKVLTLRCSTRIPLERPGFIDSWLRAEGRRGLHVVSSPSNRSLRIPMQLLHSTAPHVLHTQATEKYTDRRSH